MESKNSRISKTFLETREKRTRQVCRVFKLKIQENRLNSKQTEELKMLFVEAKWLYNDILRKSRTLEGELMPIAAYDTRTRQVEVMNREKALETRELLHLGSQMKQSIVAQMLSSIKALATSKKNGNKIGVLKFRSECRHIELKQFGVTYKFTTTRHLKIQGVSGTLRVNGLKQLENPDLELANAKLLNTPRGYFLAVTTFIDKTKHKDKHTNLIPESLGIDMGCSTHFTLSTGEKIQATVPESERLKRLQRQAARRKKGSKNRDKSLQALQREYFKLSCKKHDLAKKLVNKFLQHQEVFIQDENLQEWKTGGHGKAVHHSVLGRVKRLLTQHPRVTVVSKFKATSKSCSACGHKKEKLGLHERTFECSSCGHVQDRDLNAAVNMIKFGKESVGVERTKVKPVDTSYVEVVETGRSQLSSCD